MTLARDASSPALAVSGYIGTLSGSYASASFSPPAGSVIIVTAFGVNGYAPDGWATSNPATITDSLGTHLTWTLFLSEAAVTYEGAVWAWWAYAASAPGSMTATPTLTAGTGSYVSQMEVSADVWTGAVTTAPAGATAAGTYAGQNLTQSLTPSASGSALIMAACDAAGTGTQAAGTGCYMLDADATDKNAGEAWYGTSGGFTPTTASVAETLAITGGTTSATFEYIAYEVLASGSASGPNYATAQSSSVWVNPGNAENAPDSAFATWTAP